MRELLTDGYNMYFKHDDMYLSPRPTVSLRDSFGAREISDANKYRTIFGLDILREGEIRDIQIHIVDEYPFKKHVSVTFSLIGITHTFRCLLLTREEMTEILL